MTTDGTGNDGGGNGAGNGPGGDAGSGPRRERADRLARHFTCARLDERDVRPLLRLI